MKKEKVVPFQSDGGTKMFIPSKTVRKNQEHVESLNKGNRAFLDNDARQRTKKSHMKLNNVRMNTTRKK